MMTQNEKERMIAKYRDSGKKLLWLDDVRPEPEGWTRAHTAKEAIELLKNESFDFASLDHDLGDDHETGYTVALWMAEHEEWPEEGVSCHSMNPVGAERIIAIVKRYGPYKKDPTNVG